MSSARKGALSTIAVLAMAMGGCDPLVTSVGSWQLDSSTTSLDSGSSLDVASSPPDAAIGAPDAEQSFYIEAEVGRLDGDFIVGDAAEASGGRYLMTPAGSSSEDVPGPATARYDLEISTAGDYRIWARFHTPDWQHNRIWIAVDNGPPTKWRSTTGDGWYWYFVHPDLVYRTAVAFQLTQGHHELVLANCTDGVQIDRLYVTSLGDTPPGNDSICPLPPPDSIPVSGSCVPSCGALVGNSCDPTLCMGKPPLSAYDCAVCCYVGD